MSTRHIAAEDARLHDLTPQGSSGAASRRFRKRLAADGFTVDKGFKLKPGYLYTVVRAISARVNQNWDGWPSEELKKSYKTFIGKPVFVNHENHDPTKARGVVVAARYVENGMDKYIEVVQEIDAQRFPKLAHEIKTGGLDSVSMGAEAGFTICSYCHNKATDLHDMCDHVRNHKGKTLSRFDRRTGNKEDILVFESCHKISFFELSYVFEPADETAVASKVVVAGLNKNAALDPADRDRMADEMLRGIDSMRGEEIPHDVHSFNQLHDHIDANVGWGDEIDDLPIEDWHELQDHVNDRMQDAYINQHHPGWDPDKGQDPFDPRLIGAGKYTKEDFAAAGSRKPWEKDDAADEAEDLREIEAMLHKHAADCPPGMDCSRKTPQGEQIYKDSPNNPVNQVSYDPNGLGLAQPGSGSSSGYQGSGKSGRDGLNPAAMEAYDQFSKDFPGLSMGGYNPVVDQPWDEHATGDAFDIMTSDLDQGNSIRDQALKNPAVKHVIWQQKLWYPGGGVEDMPDRKSPTENHYDHVHINMGGGGGSAAASTNTPKAQPAETGVVPAQRKAKTASPTDDYWEWKAEYGEEADRERGPGYAPENRALREWVRQQQLRDRELRGARTAKSLADEYLDYMYGEYGGTDWDVPEHPMDIMYDEVDHGRGHQGPVSGPSGPGGPDLHHYSRRKTADRVPKHLQGLVGTWTRYHNLEKVLDENGQHAVDPETGKKLFQRVPAKPIDPRLPVFVHFQIPAADRQREALRYHLNDPSDPKHDPSRPSLPRAEAAKLAEQPDLWSVEQTDPATGLRRVRGHTNQLHLVNASFDYNRGDQMRTQTSGKKGVHAGISGYLAPQPDEPLSYSNVEYNPFTHMDFVHRANQKVVGDPDDWQTPGRRPSLTAPPGFTSNGTADHVHFSPDMSMYAARADNFGLRQPKVVFPVHESVNAANPETIVRGAKPGPQHPEVAARTRDIMEKRRQLDQAKGRSVSAMRRVARKRALDKLAWGEKEAPMAVDTLREEGSAPEDDNNDFERYVDPPQELQTPDLSQAAQIDREQELAEGGGNPMGAPGPADPAAAAEPQAPEQPYITLKVPLPAGAPQVPQQAVPPQAQAPAPPMPVTASMLDYFDRYYGRRVANWLDAIEAGRDLTPAEAADYRRQAGKLSTLENGREHSTTDRYPRKGTATMARTSIANRNKVATAGRRQHFAEGPLVDGGDRSRNDQGEQEEAFISQTPPDVAADVPTDDTDNIANTEHNLVARVQRGRTQLLRDAQALASLRQRRAFDESGGPVAEVVDPTVLTGPEGEALTGDDFVSANPNDGVVPTNPKDASLKAFAAFDSWLAQKTGKSSRRHTEANIKKAAAAFSREAGISPQALFPALGIVLREARKNDKQANTKGAKMRKRADEKLEVAAPDGRVDVEAPVANTTDAEAQASQFDVHDFGNNAGDNVANPDLSTDQNWAPGEASKTARVKTAGGLLAMRCAEGMIAAGLEPDSRERKYQLAAQFEQMNRGLIQDRVALLERFAAVRQADLRKVASGSSRGAARSPIPAGLGGGTRTAGAGPRLAAHDPSNDSTLFI